MRLTVHVTGAKKSTHEKTTKEGIVKIKQTFTTLSYSGVHPDEVNGILSNIESTGLGTPTKHYLSGDRAIGHARGKKK